MLDYDAAMRSREESNITIYVEVSADIFSCLDVD